MVSKLYSYTECHFAAVEVSGLHFLSDRSNSAGHSRFHHFSPLPS